MAMHHTVPASAATAHWGYFDARLEPVLTVQPGDSVTMHGVSGVPEVLPPEGFTVLSGHRDIHENVTVRQSPGHILTGPVAIAGAAPGDILEIVIDDIMLSTDWGWNAIRPLAGALPEDFHELRLLHIRLDPDAMTAELPWGGTLALEPFFGVMGVAPPPSWGRQTSIIPRAFGGNLDNKELGKGSRLFLPVFVPGALFSCGDGHANQGDGEVCVTAIETCLTGTFTFHLHKGLPLTMPRGETETHYITMGIDPILDLAAKQALREMITFIQERSNLSAEDAYTLCSIAADLRVTQIVNQHKGAHMMLAKELLPGG